MYIFAIIALGLLWANRVRCDVIPLVTVLPLSGFSDKTALLRDQITSALRLAVEDVNNDSDLLPGHTVKLNIVDSRAQGPDALRITCNVTDQGVYGLLGPMEMEVADLLGYLSSNTWDLPMVTWADLPVDRSPPRKMVISTQPRLDDQMEAVSRLVLQMKAERDASLSRGGDFVEYVTLIYSADSTYGQEAVLAFLSAMAKVNQASQSGDSIQVSGTLVYSRDLDFQEALLEDRASGGGRVMIVLNQGYHDEIADILASARNAEELGPDYQWIFVGQAGRDELLLGDMDLAYSARGSLAVRPCLEENIDFTERWIALDRSDFPGAGLGEANADGTLEPMIGFAYEAVLLLTRGLHETAQRLGRLPEPFFTQDTCLTSSWQSGIDVLDAIHNDSAMSRNTSFCLLNLRPDNLMGARWEALGMAGSNTSFGQDSYLPQIYPGGSLTYPLDSPSIIGRRNIKVVTKLSPPFVFITEDASGDFTYSGISVAVLQELANDLNFTYVLTHVDSTLPTNDMVGLVALSQYDMAISFITINSPRYKIVSFSYAYYDLGLSFVIRENAADQAAGLWGIFSPFTGSLWAAILAVLMATIVLMGIFEGPQNDDINGRRGHFSTAGKSAYVTLSLLFQQLTHKPETLEGYMLTSSFMFFGLIVVSSYTAELASFLTVRNIDASQYSFSALKDGSFPQNDVVIQTGGAIETSYRQDVLGCSGESCSGELLKYRTCASLMECFEAVSNGSAAATVYDSPVAEYLTANSFCDLRTTGDIFDKQHYGIALPAGSPFTSEISAAVLAIRESGLITKLEQQYIFTSACDAKAGGDGYSAVERMTLAELGGLFIIFGVLLFLCVAVHLYKKISFGCWGERIRKKSVHSIDPDDPYLNLTRSERKRLLFDILVKREIKKMMQNENDTADENLLSLANADFSEDHSMRSRLSAPGPGYRLGSDGCIPDDDCEMIDKNDTEHGRPVVPLRSPPGGSSSTTSAKNKHKALREDVENRISNPSRSTTPRILPTATSLYD